LNRFCFISATILLLVGCAAMQSVEPPRISLAGLQVLEIKGLETALEVDLRVYNRSSNPLTIQGVDLELSLNDRHLAQGVAATGKQIPAYSSDTITVTLYSSMLDLAGVLHRLFKQSQQAQAQEPLHYALSGHARISGAGLFEKVTITSKGEIDWKNLTGQTGSLRQSD
jgi:LEA14-like dessication related protein